MSKLKAKLQSNTGKILEVEFPITRPEFEKLIRDLTMDDPDGRWSFDGFLVCAAAEGRALEKCKSLTEINYYGHIVSQFSGEDWLRYQFLLDAGMAEWENLGSIINIAANVNNFCLIENISSYRDLGKFLTEEDPDYSDADNKTLREIGKKYAKERHGKISQRFFIQKCPKSWKQIYDGNPHTIAPQFRLEEKVGDDNV